MNRHPVVKWGMRIVAILVLIGSILFVFQREEMRKLFAAVTLFDEERIVQNFSSMDRLFDATEIPLTRNAVPLPSGAQMPLPGGWEGWLDRRAVTGIVVLKDGAVVHESYRLGTGKDFPRISWSLAKSYLSMLVGIALEEGWIESLDIPVTRHAPRLARSAYDGVTLRQVLQMASGVDFDDDIYDFWSDVNQMGRVLALGRSMDVFAARQHDRLRPPGREWDYVSIDTHVVAMVLRGATGRSLPDLMGEHLLDPLGAYGRPQYITDGRGVAFALGGLMMTTRDYARMGELTRLNGRFGDRQIVPEAWMIESTQPTAPTAQGAIGYGYQWWIPADAAPGEVLARGAYGQYVYVDRQGGTVIAVNAVDRAGGDDAALDDSLAMFRRIAALLEKES